MFDLAHYKHVSRLFHLRKLSDRWQLHSWDAFLSDRAVVSARMDLVQHLPPSQQYTRWCNDERQNPSFGPIGPPHKREV